MSDCKTNLRAIAEAAVRAGEPRVQFVSPQLVLSALDELEAENAKLKEPAAAFRYACPICRNSSGHKMDCQNRAYVAQLEAEVQSLQWELADRDARSK